MNLKNIIVIFALSLCIGIEIVSAESLRTGKEDKLIELEEDFSLSEEDLESDGLNQEDIETTLNTDIQKRSKIRATDAVDENSKIAEIVALNKVTSKSEKISVKIGESSFFGNIEITLFKCYKSSDLYNPIDKILLKVDEHRVDSDPETIFQGWLFSSNQSISGLNHPVYEIMALKCYSK